MKNSLNHVRILAKQEAEKKKIDQIIYKTNVYGKEVFKFSPTWKGKKVEVVRFVRHDTNKDVLRDISNEQPSIVKPDKQESERGSVDKDMGESTGRVLQKKRQGKVSKSIKKTKKDRDIKK